MGSSGVGAQLREMLNAFKHYENTTANAGPQTTDSSFMTLIWPLLPLLPPKPPSLLTELLKEPEKCDLCGTSQGMPLTSCAPTHDGTNKSVPATETTVRKRRTITPLNRFMSDIERKVCETLSSIQDTTEKTAELTRKAKELESSQIGEMTDSELLKTLKKLGREKAEKLEKVKILELKEQQLKESLLTAIQWAKSLESSEVPPKEESPVFTKLLQDKLPVAQVSFGETTISNTQD